MKIFIKHIVIILMIFTIWLLFQIFSIPCPSKLFFKVPCPACGTTRALFSLLRLDFKSYFHYNAMAIPLVICIILEIHRNLLKKELIKYINSSIILVSILYILYYFCRFWNFL